MAKKCGRCGEMKPLEEFNRKGPRQQSYCRPCSHAYSRTHNSEGHKRRLRYGLDQTAFLELVAAQNGCCAICERPISGKNCHVDHCHETRVVRGLLCLNCNTAIGQLQDSVELCWRAMQYLLQRKGRRSKAAS